MAPKWEKMINYWQDVQFRHALTFSFIVGSQREPIGSKYGSEEEPQSDIASILSQASSSKRTGLHYKIYRCPDLDRLVLRKVVDSPPNGIALPSASGKKNSNLYVSDVFGDSNAASIEALTEEIWRESGQAIIEGKYSCRGQASDSYSEYEVNIIKRAMA
ncbi:hypothetical protein [Halomonas borealis]|uniref:hypothetical protein n=1 Tax=Halomonas borealis TaxID=2508710 RepID=UPI00109F3D67|nr:hypothetical protein [Halomonas borealis]